MDGGEDRLRILLFKGIEKNYCSEAQDYGQSYSDQKGSRTKAQGESVNELYGHSVFAPKEQRIVYGRATRDSPREYPAERYLSVLAS